MYNFTQTCYIATDFTTKNPILKIAKTSDGRDIFSGKLTWRDGIDSEGKNKYQKVKFHTFKPEIYEFLKQHGKSAFDIKGFLKVQSKKEESGWQHRAEIQVTEAALHIWEDRKPIPHFQETDNYNE